MRVCFFIPGLGDGGAQRQCIALLNALQQNSGVDVHLLLLGEGEHEASLDTSHITIHRTTVRNFASPIALLFLVRKLTELQPDVLVSWLHPADIWAGVATRLTPRIKWIMTERNSAYTERAAFRIRKWMGRRWPDAVIANSGAGKGYWLRSNPNGPIFVVPNMLLSETGSESSTDFRSLSNDCLFVGRLDAQKNTSMLTAGFAAFARAHGEASLVVVGQGPEEEEMRRITAEMGVEDNIRFLGFRRDVSILMSNARLLVSLSLHEGMPNVVMEAVQSKLPAVVSDIPEHRALLGENYPYYVPLEASAEEIASVIAKAWDRCESDKAVNMYSHADSILGDMTVAKVVEQYLAIIRSVASGGA